MNQPNPQAHIPFADPQPVKTKVATLFTAAYLILFEHACHILALSSTAIRGGLIAPLHQLWGHYYRRVVFGGEGVAMPQSAPAFIITSLLALAAIKSHFQTHPQAINLSVNSLMMYGLACAAELIVTTAGFGPTSVYAIIAHVGKIVSLCVLLASLASLFYL